MNRTLTIAIEPDWERSLREAARQATIAIETGQYQGETLNFPTPAAFFGQLTANRWRMVNHLIGAGTVGVRELARQLRREPKRVHADSKVLVELGLLEKTASGALYCPYQCIHIDMRLMPPALAEAA